MAEQTINLGAAPNDGNGDPLRDGGQILNQNLFNHTKKNTNYTTLITDHIIECGAAITVNLITAVGNYKKRYNIVNVSGGNVTVDANGSETINGSLTQVLASGDSLTIFSNGTNWIIL